MKAIKRSAEEKALFQAVALLRSMGVSMADVTEKMRDGIRFGFNADVVDLALVMGVGAMKSMEELTNAIQARAQHRAEVEAASERFSQLVAERDAKLSPEEVAAAYAALDE